MRVGLDGFQHITSTGTEFLYPVETIDYDRKDQPCNECLNKATDVAKLIGKLILKIVLFVPYILYSFLRILSSASLFPGYSIGKILRQLTKSSLGMSSKTTITLADHSGSENAGKLYKRVVINIHGKKIDAMLIGTEKTLKENRWIVFSDGSLPEGYRGRLKNELADMSGIKKKVCSGLFKYADEVGANLLVYDYPFYQDSTGYISSMDKLVDIHSGILDFVEDSEKGLGAKEIIAFGYSLGGLVQLKSLANRSSKMSPGVKYVILSSRVPVSIAEVFANYVSNKVLRAISKVFWHSLLRFFSLDVNGIKAARKLQLPHIVYGSCDDDVRGEPGAYKDTSIPGEASLGYYVDTKEENSPNLVTFIPKKGKAGMNHNTVLSHIKKIGDMTKHYFESNKD